MRTVGATVRVVSIGYEGRNVEELISVLQDLDVLTVVDVRLTPVSRKPGLSKTRLAQRLGVHGIQYVHLRALGNPRENRPAFRDGRLELGVARYREHLEHPAGVDALDQLGAIAEQHSIAVLCFERDHDQCHRQVVVEPLVRRGAHLRLA